MSHDRGLWPCVSGKGTWKKKNGKEGKRERKNADGRFPRHKSDLVGRDAVYDVMCYVMEGQRGDVIRIMR